MMMLSVDAILFDLDGTLVDESTSYREAIRLTAEYMLGDAVDAQEVEAIKRVPGLNNDWDATWALIERRVHGHTLLPDAAVRGAQAYRRMQDAFQTYYLGDQLWREVSGRRAPFLWREPLIERETALISRETLDWLRNFAFGIATSRPRVEALLALRNHGLDDWFSADLLVAAEDAPREKPDPAPLLLLADRLRCRHAVYVGDTINDALAAEAAGMTFVLVGEGIDDARVVHHLGSVNNLTLLCRSLASAAGSRT